MQQTIQNSLQVIEKIDWKKYGWVFTTASIVALVFYSKIKEENRKQKPRKNSKQNETHTKSQDESIELEKQQVDKKNMDLMQQEKIVKSESEDQIQIIEVKQQKQDSQLNQNQDQINIQDLKEYKKQLIQQNLKKQLQENDKKSKKNNINSTNSSMLRSSKGKYANRLQYNEDSSFYQNPSQNLPQSDIESRQNQQIRNQMLQKKQRKYITDVDEPVNSYKRNQILKVAKDQSPHDCLFFKVLASLAENEEENQ